VSGLPTLLAPIRYLQSKGFNSNGTQVFKPLHRASTTIYNATDNTYGIQLDSTTGNGGTYFDAGPAGAGARLYIIATQSFSDNPTVTTPTTTSTFTTRSLVVYTSTTNTDPLYVRDRASGTPSVIPPSYQEARYENVPIITSRKYNAVKSDFGSVVSTAAAISSSGYYRYHGIKAGFASSSGASISQVIGRSLTTLADQQVYFITPLATGQIVSLRAQSPSVVRGSGGADMLAIAATSRSLSGAPYLNGSQWLNTQAHLIRGMFNPLYYAVSSSTNVVVAEISASSTVTPLTASGDWQFLLNNGRRASTKSNMVWLSTSNVPNVGDPPYSGTTASLSESTIVGFGPNYIANRPTYTGLTNMLEGVPTTTTWTVQPKYKAWNGLGVFNSSLSSTLYNFHTPGTLGQPASSGSLAVWISRNGQSDFTGDNTSLSTRFRDETRRKQINGLTVASAIASTWNSGSRLKLGDGGDLQYKPGANSYGWLVNPEHGANSTGANISGGYGYWYPTGSYSTGHYKWALHKFDFALGEGASYSNLTITTFGDSAFGDLVAWNVTTTNKYAIGIIFSKQVAEEATPKIYDVSGTGTFSPNLDSQGAGTSGINPFNATVSIRKDWSTRSTGTSTITLGLSNAAGQAIVNPSGANNYSDVYVLVRYKGAPAGTLQQIALSGS
jgi:hypothetical protein